MAEFLELTSMYTLGKKYYLHPHGIESMYNYSYERWSGAKITMRSGAKWEVHESVETILGRINNSG